MKSFKYTLDRATVLRTILTILLFAIVAIVLYFLYKGGFFSAWFTSLVLAVTTLMVLSIPRRIVLEEKALEIRCVSDITVINLDEIASIREVSRQDMQWVMPLFGAVGFFGYYGKFFDFKEWDTITIYASEWNHFVEIVDIYDARTYISCRQSALLIESVTAAIERNRATADEQERAAEEISTQESSQQSA